MKVGDANMRLGVFLFAVWMIASLLTGAETWQACVAGSVAGIFGVLLGMDM